MRRDSALLDCQEADVRASLNVVGTSQEKSVISKTNTGASVRKFLRIHWQIGGDIRNRTVNVQFLFAYWGNVVHR